MNNENHNEFNSANSNKGHPQFRKPTFMVNWIKEIIFLVPVALFVFLALGDQLDIIPAVQSGIAVGLMSVYVAHIVRKVMFPEMSITKLYNKALESGTGAAIVFASLIGFVLAIANLLNFQ